MSSGRKWVTRIAGFWLAEVSGACDLGCVKGHGSMTAGILVAVVMAHRSQWRV
jgi:hypothetical protein